MEIKRLDLGHLHIAKQQWPVHGYAVLHDQLGVVLIDTGCGGPDAVLRSFEVVNRTVADALGDHDLSPVDVTLVINTHLHFDHCGQNPAFAHAPLIVQRSEHERMLRQRDEITDWIEASGDYVSLHVDKKAWLVREAITMIAQRYAALGIVRIHRSTLVNLDRVTELRPLSNGEFTVVLRDGTELKMSRNYRDALSTLVGSPT